MRSVVFLLIIILQASFILAQKIDINTHIENLVQQGDESENSRYYDLLLYYADNPIDVNKTNAQELAQLGILNQAQIDAIINHINITGPFLSIYELQSLPSFTTTDIKNIQPFVTISQVQPLGKVIKGLFGGSSNYTTLGYSRVIEQSKAYTNNLYLGSPDRAQMRLRLRNPGHLSVGFTTQKDPGELWLSPNRIPQTDYVSGHIYLENQGRVKQLVMGDYRLQFGQGLVLGAGFMIGKNIETVASIKQSTLGILPYSSITEANYFRGAGVNIKLVKNLQVTMFYSNQLLDATPTKDSTLEAVSSIRTSGLHRTIAEINAANQLQEQVWGSAITYDNKQFSTGLLIINSQYNKPIIPPARIYNQFNFGGKSLSNYSWFGQYRAGNFLFFGELAKTHLAGAGVNLGMIGSISKYISMSMLYRSFDKDFHSRYGLPFSERSALGNEQGLYWGIKVYPAAGITISAYYDMYRFPWITSRTAAPSNGNDYLLRMEYKVNDQSRLFIQLRNEHTLTKEDAGNISQNRAVNLIKSIFNADYNLENPLTFRTRVQYNRFNGSSPADGWLLYQDINFNRMKFGVTGRILLFDTEDFSARQYVYEKDMLFTFNTHMFNGKGVSYYAIIKYKPLRSLTIRAKWSYTEYVNQKTIGSGNDLLPVNHKTQLTAQLHYVF